MNTCRWMSGLLATTYLSCVASLYHATTTRSADWPHPASVAMMGLALAGLTLIGAWVVFGRTNIALRCVGLLLAQLLVAYIGCQTATGHQASWSLAIGIYSVCLLTGMLLGRCYGIRLQDDSRNDSSSSTPWANGDRSRQFTLWQMLSVTTAVATMLAFWTHRSLNWDVARQSLLFFGFLSLLAMASLWSGFRGRVGFNIVLLAGGLVGASAWFQWMQYRGLDHVSLISLALVLQTSLIFSALALRTAGLRLETSKRQSMVSQQPSILSGNPEAVRDHAS